MIGENSTKAFYDSSYSFGLSKGSLIKTVSSLIKYSRKAPLSLHDYIPKKSFLNFTYEKETKYLFDTRNRNRSNPPSHKFFIIAAGPEENFNKNNKQMLIDSIIGQRKKKALIISAFVKSKIDHLKPKRSLIVNKIIKARELLAIRIQSSFRGFVIRKDWKNIALCDLVFFYDINDNMINKLTMNNNNNNSNGNFYANGNCNSHRNSGLISIKLCLFSNDKKVKHIAFNYSRGLKCYYLPLLRRGVIKKKYKVNFIVNGQTIIDPRYDVDNDDKGNFFNIISKAMIVDFKKKKTNSEVDIESPAKKYWETIFKMKSKRYRHSNSCDSLSVSNNTELSNEPFLSSTAPRSNDDSIKPIDIKPILKNLFMKSESFSSRTKGNIRHRVQFNTTVQYSY